MEYKIIENGTFGGNVASGSAETVNGALRMTNARLDLAEGVVLPFGGEGTWTADITGKLLTGNASGAQFLAGSPFTTGGRVYFGVKKETGLVCLGVRLHTVYVNFGRKMANGFDFSAKHSYSFRYDGKYFRLAIDGSTAEAMTEICFNQTENRLAGDEKDAWDFCTLVRTVTAQNYAEMTNLGAEDEGWTAEIENFTVKTDAPVNFKRYLAHPLSDTKIFYLGSSITYGEASGGVAFGEIIHAVTGNPFTKEAVSGTTLVNSRANSYAERLHNFDFSQKPDFLVVQLSTNDFSTDQPLGSVQQGTNSAGFDKTTVSGAIQYIIAYAKEQCPTCKVVLYTCAVRANWEYAGAYETYINGDFAKICEKWQIEPTDIFHASLKNYPCFWSDDIHPTLEGYAAGWTPLFVRYFTDRV